MRSPPSLLLEAVQPSSHVEEDIVSLNHEQIVMCNSFISQAVRLLIPHLRFIWMKRNGNQQMQEVILS